MGIEMAITFAYAISSLTRASQPGGWQVVQMNPRILGLRGFKGFAAAAAMAYVELEEMEANSMGSRGALRLGEDGVHEVRVGLHFTHILHTQRQQQQ